MAKRIVILGAGESGAGAAVLAKKQGFDTFVSDMSTIKDTYKNMLNERGIEWEEGKHTESLILNADEVIKSPGIPNDAPMILKLKSQGTPIISEIEFAGRYTNAKMICITGSNGKTTTTSLIYHIFKKAGMNVGLAGNIGQSLAYQVAECNYDYYVIELSSFQLDNMYKFHANIAVLMNITPDHLDRYDHQMQNYVDAKFRIIQNQTPDDAFIFWNDDPIIQRELHKYGIHGHYYPFAERKEEGTALEKKFNEKIDNIERLLKSIEPYETERVAKIRERITDALEKTISVDYDKNRLEQELIYYIEKLDINEEKQRLSNHLRYFRETMAGGHGQGKKLGFIAQEMGREINTTGSKSNHAEMQNIVVQMKDELEQIKEQVLNVM